MALFTKPQLRKKAQLRKSLGQTKTASAKLLDEARKFDPEQRYDIFLSHTVLDADMVWELRCSIWDLGYSVYVDWLEDPQLDRTQVTRRTAALLKIRMNACRSLFFVTTANSKKSVWMPWELGYFDGKGGRVAILPVLEAPPEVADAYKGSEYLSLYPYVSLNTVKQTNQELAAKQPLRRDLFIKHAPDDYVRMRSWLSGKNPQPRSPPLIVAPRFAATRRPGR